MNRGLIEALTNAEGLSKREALPRFMNRGLIEAGRPTVRCCDTAATSPIHESGPH